MREVEVYVPVRIDLTGGATDISPFKDREGGRIVNLSVNLNDQPSVCVRASQIKEKAIVLRTEDGPIEEHIDSWESLKNYSTPLRLLKTAVFRKMRSREGTPFSEALLKTFASGVYCSVTTSLPNGSGLGTSGSIGIALVQALDVIGGSEVTYLSSSERYGIAAIANALESEDLLITSGGQDQLAAVFGGFNDITFSETCATVQKFSVPRSAQEELEKHSLIVFTGQSRISGESLDRTIESYSAGNDRTVKALRGIKELGEEMSKALKEGEISKAGQLLRISWKLRRELHNKISNKGVDFLMRYVDNLVEGGYLCGAGGGGCAYFIAKKDRINELRKRVTELKYSSYTLSVNPSGMSTIIDRSKIKFMKLEDLEDIQRGRYNTESAMAILLNEQGEVLLNLRDNKPYILYPAHWALFGGGVTPGETNIEGLQRELREEIGYAPQVTQEYGKIIDHDGHGHLVTVFVGKIDRTISQLTLREGTDMRFFDRSCIPDLKITPFLKEVLMHYLSGS